MQHSMPTLTLVAALVAVALLSLPTQAEAQHYGHGHGHFGHGHGHGYGHGYEGHGHARCDCGWVRISLEPRELREEAQVLVDGAHAGAVDDFDGFFQRLALPPGGHEIQITVDGHRSLRRRILVSRNRTYQLRHRLEPLTAAELRERVDRTQALAGRRTQTSEASLSRATSRTGPTSEYGAIRIKAMPGYEDAQVYVDGAHAGVVDEFDGFFQKLSLRAGRHDIEIMHDGSSIYRKRVLVSPRRTYEIRQQGA